MKPMNENERVLTNHMTALQGEKPYTVEGHGVRRLGVESLSVLEMLGHPLAAPCVAVLNKKQPVMPELGMTDVAVLVWVLAEDPDEVLRVAMDCAPGFADPARAAALRFLRGWSCETITQAAALPLAEVKALAAAMYNQAAPGAGSAAGAKKND